MKNRHYIHPATLFFVLSVVVVLLSWIGNIYGWEGVRNLLSAEGLRWKLRTVGDTFLNVPFLGDMMILFLGGGLAVHSGWSAASLKLLKKRSQLSRRELKAWLMGTVCGIIILLLWGILAWGPWGGLRSISGGMSDSPLQEGSACILSAILGITGLVYGYAVDFYHSDKDIVRGMAFGFIRFPEFFVTLFFVVQFFGDLEYTRLTQCLGIQTEIMKIIYVLSILLSLSFALGKKKSIFAHIN